jgi:protein SCO1/2
MTRASGLALAAVLAASAALAQSTQPAPPAQGLPPALRDVGWDQRIGEKLPLDLPLRDEAGRAVRLGDYFGKRPVVLSFVYYGCPMLCTLSLNGLVSAMGVLSLDPGREYEVVTVSFDPRDGPEQAAAQKQAYLKRLRREGAGAGWHFLTGDAAGLGRLTQAAGFRYAWDDETRQFAHPAGVVLATPDGTLARYLFGIEYAPRDLRYGLVEASAGRLGTPLDQVVLYCYNYDPTTGRYGVVIMRVVRLGGVATVLALAGFVGLMLRRERAQARRARAAAAAAEGPR